jgi:catechol 2,3-dioxygenase-like lactoylglutathione lyase family enzyme
MAVQLNHTIVKVTDKRASAEFLADVLGLPAPKAYGPFLIVEADNGVSLDFADDHGDVHPQHYAFLVSEEQFDEVFGRIQERQIDYFANPDASGKGQINTRDGGRGCYFADPDGHWLEILTRPYGSGGG